MNNTIFNTNLRQLPQTEEVDIFVSNALRYLIQHVLRKIANSFVVTISTAGTPSEFWFHYVMGNLFTTWGFLAVQLVVQDSKHKYVRIPGRRYCNMIMVDSFESLHRTNIAEYNRNYDTMEYYIIFLQIRDSWMLPHKEKILKYCSDNYLLHCNVMVQNVKGEVLIYTYFPFQESGCFQTDSVLINQFDGERFVNDEMFPNKVSNLHGCPLSVSAWNAPPFVNVKLNASVLNPGFEMDIIRALSRDMNFTVEENIVAGEQSLATNRTEAFELLNYRGTNITAGFFRRTPERDTVATPTFVTYYPSLEAVLLRRENQYQSMEILAFPFDICSWTLLTFSSLTLFVINCIQHKVKGSLTSWHIIEVLLGVPTYRIPKRLSLRATFIIWVLSTFILRSVYQSLLFYLFRTEFYRDPPDSFAELAESQYTVVCTLTTEPIVQHIPELMDRSLPLIVLNTSDEMEPLRYLEKYSHQNFVAISVIDFAYYYVHTERQSGSVFILLGYSINSQQISFYIPKHSYLIQRFDECILDFHQSGFLNFWRDRSLASYRVTVTSYNNHYEDPLLINMKQFFGFMKILFFLNFVSIIVFFVELLSMKVVRLQRIL